ncbi:hypothetical protein [Caballeronia udeis]
MTQGSHSPVHMGLSNTTVNMTLSNSTVNMYGTVVVVEVVRQFANSRDEKLRMLSKQIAAGNTAAALSTLVVTEAEYGKNVKVLAQLYYTESHLRLLAGDLLGASEKAQLASTLEPKNCRYRSSIALLHLSTYRFLDAGEETRSGNVIVDECTSGTDAISIVMIRFVRAALAANDRNEQIAKAEMDALDRDLNAVNDVALKKDQYYSLFLTCIFSSAARSWWQDSAKRYWPAAEQRCLDVGARVEKNAVGASVLAKYVGTDWDPLMRDSTGHLRADRLSEQIRTWSNTSTIPALGIDDATRDSILGSLYVQRGFTEVWETYDVPRAMEDYRVAFGLLQPPAEALRPGAMIAFADLYFKTTNLENLSERVIVPDIQKVMTLWVEKVASSELEGVDPDNCNALGGAASVAYVMRSPRVSAIDAKLKTCSRVFIADTVGDLQFRAMQDGRRGSYYLSIGDQTNALAALNDEITTREKMSGFPFPIKQTSSLEEALLNRAIVESLKGDVELAVRDSDSAGELAFARGDLAHSGKAWSQNAYYLNLSRAKAGPAQATMDRAVEQLRVFYVGPEMPDDTCLKLSMYVTGLQVDVRLSIVQQRWQDASRKISAARRLVEANYKTCSERTYGREGMGQMLFSVMVQHFDLLSADKMVRKLAEGQDLKAIGVDNLIERAHQAWPTTEALETAMPIVSEINRVLESKSGGL